MGEYDKTRFPRFAIKHWWNLRRKFQESFPGAVTGQYLTDSLGISDTTARTDVVPGLKALGLIDDDGKTTPLARRWPNDEEYRQVCAEMVRKVYPSELLKEVPDPWNDEGTARQWFASATKGGGYGLQKKLTAFYSLLAEGARENATPTNQRKPKPGRSPNRRSTARPSASSPIKGGSHETEGGVIRDEAQPTSDPVREPNQIASTPRQASEEGEQDTNQPSFGAEPESSPRPGEESPEQVPTELPDELKSRVRNDLYKEMREEVRDELVETMTDQVRSELRKKLAALVREDLREELRREVRNELAEELKKDVREELRKKMGRKLKHEKRGRAVNLSLVVQISADSTPEQTEKLFESLNRHLLARDQFEDE